ncbi:MAG TPA: hypothetical protein VLG69_00565 [Candidatus Andersenbacteria bacterium]|nr:hypothetical protein [Candidatus Andersenbacteria bacterium]
MTTYNSFLSVWSTAVTNSLSDLWVQFISFIPNVIAAVVVFIVGWAIAVAVGRLIEKLLVLVRINAAFESLRGLKRAVEQAGLTLNIAHLVGEIFKWFFIIVSLLAATNILGLQQVSEFLTSVLYYIPNVVIAALILVISVVLANFVYRTVLATVEAAGFTSGGAIAAICKWSILVFAIFAALLQLNVASQLIQTFLTAFFAMVAIAGGLAFGLGGKDLAAKWLAKAEHDIAGRKR